MHDFVETVFAYLQKGLTALVALIAGGSAMLRAELAKAGLGQAGQTVVQIGLVAVLLLFAFRVLGTAFSLILALVLLLLVAEVYFPEFANTMKQSIG